MGQFQFRRSRGCAKQAVSHESTIAVALHQTSSTHYTKVVRDIHHFGFAGLCKFGDGLLANGEGANDGQPGWFSNGGKPVSFRSQVFDRSLHVWFVVGKERGCEIVVRTILSTVDDPVEVYSSESVRYGER